MPFETVLRTSAECPVIILRDGTTGSEAEIFAFGGILNAFHIPVNGGLQNVVDGFTDLTDAQKNITNGFKSTKLSPFVCRMNKGIYLFEDTTYGVKKHFLNGHAIHGLIYDAVYEITDMETCASYASVTLVHEYAGTDPGYPFTYKISLTWKLEQGNHLSVSTTISHHNKTAIPLADGWHPYFSLGGSIDECVLQFSGSHQLEYDDALLPTGKKLVETRFTNGCLLKDINLDNGFEWDDPNQLNQCVVSNSVLKLVIEADNSYPVLQVYTPPHRKSIAIENLSGAPDNFNNGMHLIMLPPGKEKTFNTSYTVTVL